MGRLIAFRYFLRVGIVPVTKRKFVEILILCCLVILTLVVSFGNKTFADDTRRANFTGTRSIESIPTPVEVGSQLRGVVEYLGFDDLRRELKSTNGWVGEIEGLVYSLSAGYYRNDESLGLVQLRILTTEPYSRTTVNVDCPRKSGALRVEDAKGSRVILRASNGELFYFDLLARQFVESLDVVVPTATPFPPPRTEYPNPTPTLNPYP